MIALASCARGPRHRRRQSRDDVSLLMVLIDTNPFLWNSIKSSLPFSKFLSHVVVFLNSILLLNQLNQVVVIATGYNSCDYIFDSSTSQVQDQRAEHLTQKLEEFVEKDESLGREDQSMGLGSRCYPAPCQWPSAIFKECFVPGPSPPRILCLHGSPDGPAQV